MARMWLCARSMRKRNNYRAGRAREYQAMHMLRDIGFAVSRNAGSHGLWDVMAINENIVRLIQVKKGSAKQTPEEREAFRVLPVPENCTKEVWSWSKRGKPPTIAIVP